MNNDWKTCGMKTDNRIDLNGGADLRKMHEVFMRIAQDQGK